MVMTKKERKEYNRQYYIKNKEKRNEQAKQYYLNHKEELLEDMKQYQLEHKEEIKEYYKQYKLEHKEEYAEYYKQYKLEHKEELLEYSNQYEKTRRQNDPVYKLRRNISTIIGQALKRSDGSKFGKSVMKYLPYTIEELKQHLEKQFEPWMSWKNYGTYNSKNIKIENDISTYKWHIDHIIPQSKLPYDTMDNDNFLICWSLENLRPLEAVENMKKGNK